MRPSNAPWVCVCVMVVYIHMNNYRMSVICAWFSLAPSSNSESTYLSFPLLPYPIPPSKKAVEQSARHIASQS